MDELQSQSIIITDVVRKQLEEVYTLYRCLGAAWSDYESSEAEFNFVHEHHTIDRQCRQSNYRIDARIDEGSRERGHVESNCRRKGRLEFARISLTKARLKKHSRDEEEEQR